MKKVSVLIPTYNRAILINHCLLSIVKQTYKNLDIIVYDDGSTDHTENVVRSFDDLRIRYYKEERHQGVSFARNALLDLADSDIACWQDSDDISNIHRIQIQYEAIIQFKNCFLTTNHIRLTAKNALQWPLKPIVSGGDKCGSFASIMFENHNVPKFIKGVDFGGEDVEWTCDLKEQGRKHINIAERLYYVRLTNNDRIGCLKMLGENKEKREESDKKKKEYRRTL